MNNIEICDARYTVMTRGRGAGKTTTALRWAIEKALAGETVLFIGMRGNYVFDSARLLLEGYYHEQGLGYTPTYETVYARQALRFSGGGKIIFRSEDIEPDDVRGENLSGVVVDDVNPKNAEQVFYELDAHLRLPDSQMVVFGTRVTAFMGIVMSARPGEVDIDVRAIAEKRLRS